MGLGDHRKEINSSRETSRWGKKKKEIRVSCHPVKKDKKKIPRDHVVKQNNGLPKRSMF